jgi:hypothetical protein
METTTRLALHTERAPWLRSTGAIFTGLLSVVGASLATDELLHVLDVYPPWGEPMYEPHLNLLALSYRCVYAVLGSYVAARLAPHAAMRHALILGFIGVALSSLGAIAALNANLGPVWYPVSLVVTALPCAWLGGFLARLWPPR